MKTIAKVMSSIVVWWQPSSSSSTFIACGIISKNERSRLQGQLAGVLGTGGDTQHAEETHGGRCSPQWSTLSCGSSKSWVYFALVSLPRTQHPRHKLVTLADTLANNCTSLKNLLADQTWTGTMTTMRATNGSLPAQRSSAIASMTVCAYVSISTFSFVVWPLICPSQAIVSCTPCWTSPEWRHFDNRAVLFSSARLVLVRLLGEHLLMISGKTVEFSGCRRERVDLVHEMAGVSSSQGTLRIVSLSPLGNGLCPRTWSLLGALLLSSGCTRRLSR